MTTIVTRSGKGSPLTHTEVDTNFTNLNTAKLEAGAIALGSAATPSISFTGDTSTGIYSPGAYQVAVATNGTEKLIVLSNGNVGIGTSSPTEIVDVGPSSPGLATATNIRIMTGNTGGTNIKFFGGGNSSPKEVARIRTYASNYTEEGNIGLFTASNDGANNLTLSQKLTILASGNVGIGTTGPGTELHISRATAGRVITRLADPDGRTTELRSPDNVGNTAGVGTTTNHPFVFFQNNTEAARIDESKRLLVGTITQVANANGGILQLGSGITFPATAVAASDANTLDDYEEGTWTPVLTFGGNAVGLTYIIQTGQYVKIGNTITVSWVIALSNKGSSTGTASISGLPFTSSGISVLALFDVSNSGHTYGQTGATTTISLYTISTAGTRTGLTNSNFTNGSEVLGSITLVV